MSPSHVKSIGILNRGTRRAPSLRSVGWKAVL